MPESKKNASRQLKNKVAKLETRIIKLEAKCKQMDDALYKWGATSVYLAQGAITLIALQKVLVEKGLVTDEELTKAIQESEIYGEEDGTSTEEKEETGGGAPEENN